MKYTLLLLLLLGVTRSFGQKSSYNFNLAIKIDSLYSVDQKWRYMDLHYKEGNLTNTALNKFIEENWRISDSLNLLEAKNIFNAYGFPGYSLVGTNSSNNYWMIIQHADNDLAFQEEILKQMKVQVDRNNANVKNYAYLVDRVKVNKNDKQIYGTQMSMNKDKTSYMISNVENPNRLNERRKTVGLGPIEEYIKTMNYTYASELKKH